MVGKAERGSVAECGLVGLRAEWLGVWGGRSFDMVGVGEGWCERVKRECEYQFL